MHVHFMGESDDAMSVSSHHAWLLSSSGATVSFDDGRSRPRSVPRKADVIHLVTFGQTDNRLLRCLLSARKAGTAIVRCWTGIDYLWARFHPPSRRFAHAVGQLGAVQIASSELLARDLSSIGVSAEAGIVASRHVSSRGEPHPLPEQLTVLCHLPSSCRRFYGGPVVDYLIRRLPFIRFIILGDQETDYSPFPNVESLGFTEDVVRSIQRATVTIHPLAYGETSRFIVEALSHGRHAVTSFDWPHCVRARTPEEFEQVLRRMPARPPFNLAGREYVCSIYDKTLAQRALHDLMKRAVNESRSTSRFHGKLQAASVVMRYPGVYSRRPFALPHPDSLPPQAEPFRLLLEDQLKADEAAAR
ncbi:MAG: glycosyltransferase [Phycisphaerales bacterium]|nr:MAG: glycosyltransferase [Phycisphaerales bacterium]